MYKGKRVEMIVAVSQTNGIGYKNTLPWDCKEDMKHFRETTMGKVCIVGMNTYFGPLKGRTLIVVSRTVTDPTELKGYEEGNVYLRNDIAAAMDLAVELTGDKPIMIMGGRSVYEQTINLTDLLHKSIINVDEFHTEFDTYWDIEIPTDLEVSGYFFDSRG